MSSYQMTDKDWAIYLAEWESSLTQPRIEESSLVLKDEKGEKPEIETVPWDGNGYNVTGDNCYAYIRKERTTHKAIFFTTECSMSATFGFWCPKAAIIKDENDSVQVATWCKISIIEFN